MDDPLSGQQEFKYGRDSDVAALPWLIHLLPSFVKGRKTGEGRCATEATDCAV